MGRAHYEVAPADVVLAVNEQIVWWTTRGVTVRQAGEALGTDIQQWERIRRHMERWMMQREG